MRLMDKPYPRIDKDDTLKMLDGCICRICISDDPLEIVRMVGFANDHLSMLAQNRMLEIQQEKV